MIKPCLLSIAAGAALLPAPLWANSGRMDIADSGDTAWVLATSLLGLLILPALTLLYGGRLQRKNVTSMALQCAAILASTSVLWAIVGYTLAFGDGDGGWLGAGNAWMLIQLGNVRVNSFVPESAYVVLQMVFAVLAPALLIGAWAERARFGWVILFTAFWGLIVYAPVTHWIMGGGWLAQGVGTGDWAGGITVHASAGVSALVLALILGKRKTHAAGSLPQHSPLLTVLGAGLLWIAALALNGGAALTANDDSAAAMIATHLALASAALTWLALDKLRQGKTTAFGFGKGVMSGFATISAASGFISPGSALLFGVIGSALCYASAAFISRKGLVDDALHVFAINGIGGITGALLLAPFLSEALGGTGYGERMNMIAQGVAQVIGLGVVLIWSMLATAGIALLTSVALSMRVSEDTEREGLDTAHHGHHAWDFH